MGCYRSVQVLILFPDDATRVKLDIIGGDYATDYINASFIKGYSGEEEYIATQGPRRRHVEIMMLVLFQGYSGEEEYIATQGPKEETCRDHDASFGYSGEEEYIATQGPKEETCADFWRMVYQHNVKLIVMVTQFEEQNKVKCHRYFPPLRENLVIADFVVRCTTELSFPIYTDRTLVIHKNGRKKSVKHFHFQEWPDFGCPENTHFMLQFCSTMRQHIEDDAGLTLVHCSAGVGRTGTLIAIDILLQHIKENKKIDIFNTVYQLRQQRTNMVQTELQYKYIYQCLLEALQDAAFIHPGKLSSPAQSPEPIYENMLGHSPYEKLVKPQTGLCKVSWLPTGLRKVSWPPTGLRKVSWPQTGLRKVSWPQTGLRKVSWPSTGLRKVSWPPTGLRKVSWPPRGLRKIN
uniref:protein-tyrosine-phosphatase n=1 Tax=Timema bartmani TaxID=61472 RepID=A0A7R9F785_9NEOP|nr:unnamed protein product [Timema bartmani]